MFYRRPTYHTGPTPREQPVCDSQAQNMKQGFYFWVVRRLSEKISGGAKKKGAWLWRLLQTRRAGWLIQRGPTQLCVCVCVCVCVCGGGGAMSWQLRTVHSCMFCSPPPQNVCVMFCERRSRQLRHAAPPYRGDKASRPRNPLPSAQTEAEGSMKQL